MIEPEIKLVFACLLLLMVLANASNGHAVLPAFVVGLVMSRHYQQHREEQRQLLAGLLSAKMLPKIAFVSRSRRERRRDTRPSPRCS